MLHSICFFVLKLKVRFFELVSISKACKRHNIPHSTKEIVQKIIIMNRAEYQAKRRRSIKNFNKLLLDAGKSKEKSNAFDIDENRTVDQPSTSFASQSYEHEGKFIIM